MPEPPRDPLEVRQIAPLYRAFVVIGWTGIAAFFYGMAYTHPSRGNWMGYGMGGVAFWFALYWLRAPAVIARADDAGITFADTRLGLFFVYGECRAAWADVLGVATRHRTTRAGRFLRTRIRVRGEAGQGTRAFTITSRCAGYGPFVEAVHARTGLAVEPPPIGRARLALFIAIVLALIGVSVALFLARRP